MEALREPGRKQTTGYLESGGGNCCLGVACRVAMANGLDLTTRVLPSLMGRGITTFDHVTTSLPARVQTWYGLDRDNPQLLVAESDKAKYDGPALGAVTMNDGHRFTFAQIADCIERTYLGDGEATDGPDS